MLRNNKFSRIVLTLLVVVMLAAPFAASAGSRGTAWGLMIVWPHSSRAYTLNVNGFAVTVPSGALPNGGIIIERVTVKGNGEFSVEFYPDYRFSEDVIMDFRSAETVYYHSDSGLIAIPTYDLDNNGEVGEFFSEHFSRYSGWY